MNLAAAILQLKNAGVEDPEREVHYLLQYCQAQQIDFTSVLARRCAREPFAYITGVQPFWTLDIQVNSNVLIPRPETEHLGEAVLKYLREQKMSTPKILDLCTGSGCIPAALASEIPNAQFTVSDLSSEALQVARKNLNFAVDRTEFFQGDLFAALPEPKLFDVITANPPYIAAADFLQLSAELKHEPELALLANEEGLACLKKIIQDAPQFLAPDGIVVLEYGFGQTQALLAWAKQHHYQSIQVNKDLAGIERVLVLARK